VHLVHRRDEFRASKLLQERAFTNPKIQVIRNTIVPEIVGNTRASPTRCSRHRNGRALQFSTWGVSSSRDSSPIRSSSKATWTSDAGGYLITDNRMITSMADSSPGDSAGVRSPQITTAVGDATNGGDPVESISVPARAAGRRKASNEGRADRHGVFAENCYLIVATDPPSVIVDPGEEAGLILHKIEKRRAALASLLTHAHVDHVLVWSRSRAKWRDRVAASADRPLYAPWGEQAGWFGLVPPGSSASRRDLVAASNCRSVA